MSDYDRDALAEISSFDRQQIIAALRALAAHLDLERKGPAARFLASIAAAIRAAERKDFLRLDAFEDAINEPRGELVPDGTVSWSSDLPNGAGGHLA